ncbi:MAG: hypothetical protein JO097_03280 [Acidobacteriaceae bacterium]|nr:hypothetical protein [Acidobacteriaceae bacterium]MBV9764151.1 hypothetical protein [Acidobacteriaceae bacterium]
MKYLSKRIPLAILALATSASFGSAQSTNRAHACDDAILEGDYAFTITGEILGASAPAPVAGVAMTYFDGKGNLRQVDHVLHGGKQPPVDWRPGTGTYKIDLVSEEMDTDTYCVGKATITPVSGPPLDLFIVVAKDGSEVRTVVNDMGPKGPPVAITSIGIRRRTKHFE